jgi:DNA-binding NarL/FixJ family response regulator
VIKVEILDSYPIFAQGLARILVENGFQITGVKASSTQGLSWRADVFVVDVNAVGRDLLGDFVAESTVVAPVLLMVSDPAAEVTEYCLKTGISGYLERSASPSLMVEAIRSLRGVVDSWVS